MMPGEKNNKQQSLFHLYKKCGSNASELTPDTVTGVLVLSKIVASMLPVEQLTR